MANIHSSYKAIRIGNKKLSFGNRKIYQQAIYIRNTNTQ